MNISIQLNKYPFNIYDIKVRNKQHKAKSINADHRQIKLGNALVERWCQQIIGVWSIFSFILVTRVVVTRFPIKTKKHYRKIRLIKRKKGGLIVDWTGWL